MSDTRKKKQIEDDIFQNYPRLENESMENL